MLNVHMLVFPCLPICTLQMQDQVPQLVSLSRHSPVTLWRWCGHHLTTQEVCPLLATTSHTLTHKPIISYMDTLIQQWYPYSSSNQAPNTLWGWGSWMLLEKETLHSRAVERHPQDVSYHWWHKWTIHAYMQNLSTFLCVCAVCTMSVLTLSFICITN